MHPAAKRSTRSRVSLTVGPLSVTVNIFSGVHKPESPKTFCTGAEDAPHTHTELRSLGRHCPLCSEGHGRLVEAFRSDDGALVPITRAAEAERLQDVSALRDRIDLVRVSAADFSASAIETGNIYWLVPSTGADEVNYLGLLEAIQGGGMILLGAWASRIVAKPYRVGVHAGMLTLTELVPADSLRAAPAEPPVADAKSVAKAAAAFALLAEEASAEDVAQLAVDPGRAALTRAANAARENGSDVIKLPRGARVMFDQRLAEASLAAELEKKVVAP